MSDYNLDAIAGAMPTITVDKRTYRMKPISPADVAVIAKAQTTIAAGADGHTSDAVLDMFRSIVRAALPDLPEWQVSGGYRSPLHRLFRRRERGLDTRRLSALASIIMVEIAKLMPSEDDVKNAQAPPAK